MLELIPGFASLLIESPLALFSDAGLLLLGATDDAGFLSGFLGGLVGNLLLWAKVALGIGLVIFVHELGHFVAAKTFGVKCEKFYVGFDVPLQIGPIKFPRTLGKFTYGETEYGIGVIPLGGYVKMLGQNDDPRKLEEENKRIQVEGDVDEAAVEPQLNPRSFPAKPVWQRMIIMSAGVIVNVITGVLFAAMAFGFGVSYKPAVVGGVSSGGPAWQAGIEPGGQVVSIGNFHDDKMPFREMRNEILNLGIKTGEKAIPVSIRYDDGVRDFQLSPASIPENKEFRMIGVAMPNSLTLKKEAVTYPGSIAATVLGEADRGATIVAYDGHDIDSSKIVPSTDFFDYLYTHPQDSIDLQLLRSDGTQHNVTLPPQIGKTIGLRYSIGPTTALVAGGPAEKAGMLVGDVIQAVNGKTSNETNSQTNQDAYGLAIHFVGADSPTTFTVKRGDETLDLEITPGDMAQPLPPMTGMGDEIGLNRFGFAYQPSPVISKLVGAKELADDALTDDEKDKSANETLQPGDRIKSIRLLLPTEGRPEFFSDPRYQHIIKEFTKGWEFSRRTPLTAFVDNLQAFPLGTRFEVHAVRPPEDRVVTATVQLTEDDRVVFVRGLMFQPVESIRQATSLGDAISLGIREGQRRFQDVTRFLEFAIRGKLGLKHVGGPLAIVGIAKNEAEKGISHQLMFLTMLSMNLAILNFLPIPALDGGHMVFLAYEWIAGKRANEQLEFRLTVFGLLALLALMVVVFANDLMRYLG